VSEDTGHRSEIMEDKQNRGQKKDELKRVREEGVGAHAWEGEPSSWHFM